jgi:phosphopantetheine adenylyltransferase
MLRMLEDQKPDVKMILIPTQREFAYISSSMIRSLEKIQSGAASEYIVKPEMFETKKEDTK